MRESLDELESSAKRYSSNEEFVAFIREVVEFNYRHNGADDDKVSLMTIHKSKGLEFPVVYLIVIGVSEGNMPHSSVFEAGRKNDIFVTHKGRNKITAALEEERRLVYVAITRAKDELIVSSPAYYRGKKKAVSRFILAAFPKQTTDNARTKLQHSSMISKTSIVNTTQTETVYAWICTSETCNVWKRIRTFEEAELPSKSCPVCRAPMKKGSKEVMVIQKSYTDFVDLRV